MTLLTPALLLALIQAVPEAEAQAETPSIVFEEVAKDIAAAMEAQPDPRPAVWKLTDDDTTIYLLGTFHILPNGVEWQNELIGEIVAQADQLLIEAKLPTNPLTVVSRFAGIAFSADQPPLKQRIDEQYHAKLDALIEESPFPASLFDKLDSWAVAMMLGSFGNQANEVYSLESGLYFDFSVQEKPTGELESWREQMHAFDILSAPAQKSLLQSTIAQDFDTDSMLGEWLQGNAEGMLMVWDDDPVLNAEMTEKLLQMRNGNWAIKLAARMDEPGTVLVAVGASHMVGDQSLLQLLSERGFAIERIQ